MGLGSSSVVVARPDVSGCDLGDQRVLLDLSGGRYHGLNEVARRVWSLLGEPVRVEDLCAAIRAEYEVDEETCLDDVLALLSDLERASLIEVRTDGERA